MKLAININKEPHKYLVRLQSRVPKFSNKHKKKGMASYNQRKAISVRVTATNEKEAREKALQRKQSMSKTATYRVLSVRRLN